MTEELRTRMRKAIADPGSFLPREAGETVANWGARAILAHVVGPELERLRTELAAMRHRAELAEDERNEQGRQLESLARRLHIRFQNEQRMEAQRAALAARLACAVELPENWPQQLGAAIRGARVSLYALDPVVKLIKSWGAASDEPAFGDGDSVAAAPKQVQSPAAQETPREFTATVMPADQFDALVEEMDTEAQETPEPTPEPRHEPSSQHSINCVGCESPAPEPTAEAEPVADVEHHLIVTGRRPAGSRRSGTHAACTCGAQLGIVSNEPQSSKDGKAAARRAHERHLTEVVGEDQ